MSKVSWQGVHTPVTPDSALCLACVPAMFGNAAPAGGLAWQEVQFRLTSGDFPVMLPVVPSPWHVVQVGGDDEGEDGVTAWHPWQLALYPVWSTPVWAVVRKGTEWFAPPVQEYALWSRLWQVNVPHVWPWAV